MKILVVLVSLSIVLVQAGPLAHSEDEENSTGIFSSFSKCTMDSGITGIVNCAAARALKMVEKAQQEPLIQLLPGVTLTKDISADSTRVAKELKLNDLPTDSSAKSDKLLNMLLESASNFISGRSLKIKLPETASKNFARALEEGRGKMKKMMGPLMLGLGAKMITVIPIMLGGLALLAAKALLIGKLAFVISLILFANYFFSGRNGIPSFGYNSYGTSYGGGYGTYGTNQLGGWGASPQYGAPYAPYARSIDAVGVGEVAADSKTAQEIAYSSHK